jgi:hypothetical protein
MRRWIRSRFSTLFEINEQNKLTRNIVRCRGFVVLFYIMLEAAVLFVCSVGFGFAMFGVNISIIFC